MSAGPVHCRVLAGSVPYAFYPAAYLVPNVAPAHLLDFHFGGKTIGSKFKCVGVMSHLPSEGARATSGYENSRSTTCTKLFLSGHTHCCVQV